MALDIYNINDRNRTKILFSIKENNLNLLRTIFEIFRSKTGVEIDLYGTTRLYEDHIQLLIDIILNQAEINNTPQVSEFVKFLNQTKKDQISLILEGD